MRTRWTWIILGLAALLPALDLLLPPSLRVAELLPPILVFAVIALGLNLVTGFTGQLQLGSAAFVAIGAYIYAILTCDIYPFQLGFWPGCLVATVGGALCGGLLALPLMRLRGDYLAVVTLGFGEIVQESLRNLEAITKGTQGINPLPGITGGQAWQPRYWILLAITAGLAWACQRLRDGRVGRAWVAVREDELAARAMGVPAARVRLSAFALGSGLCALGGALWAALNGSSGDPGNYNFQLSVVVLCIVILGGLGSVPGVLLGTLLIMGFNGIILAKIADWLGRLGIGGGSVFTAPANWKYLIFGLVLIVMMRLRPEGLWPAREVRAELHRPPDDEEEA